MESYQAVIVDHSAVYQKVLSQLVEQQNFAATCFSLGEEALQHVRQNPVDLICMGMALSDMSGADLCRKLATLPHLEAEIILITTEDDKASLQAALLAGAAHIFNKKHLTDFASYLQNSAFARGLNRKSSGKILFLEDSAAQARLIHAMLTQGGHQVSHFSNAEEGLSALQNHSFDLVLTDLYLEGAMTGFDVVRRIRDEPRLERVPVLIISVVDEPEKRVALLKSGANDFIAKPIIEEELMLRVENALQQKKLLETLLKQQQYLQQVALKDQLTQLYNRHFLMEMGPKKITECYRHGHPMSMLVIDADHFKSINDTHGHSSGDEILKLLAHIIRTSSRNEDIPTRFGGEEFVLLLPHCRLNDAVAKAERLRQSIEATPHNDIRFTVSIGVSALDDSGEDTLSTLFDRADRGTYIAKEQGRNRVISVTA